MIPVVIVNIHYYRDYFYTGDLLSLRIRSLEQKQTLSDLITILSYSRIRLMKSLTDTLVYTVCNSVAGFDRVCYGR